MKRMLSSIALFRFVVPLAIVFASSGCATRLSALNARYFEPDYVVTKDFFAEAPQRVAVLPFATSHDNAAKNGAADVCRKAFYQHMVLRDYETPSLRFSDTVVLGTNREQRTTAFGFLTKAIRALDIVGMTTVVDLDTLTGGHEQVPHLEFRELISTARTNAHADACCIGVTRKFGRLYAVLFSSVGISTRVEMWSANTGRLLWAAEMKNRNFAAAISIDLISIPMNLWDVWLNARGYTLGTLAYDVYGHICETLPYVGFPHTVSVEVTRDSARVFKTISPWMLWDTDELPKGTVLTFLREENGWYKCQKNGGPPVWIYRGYAQLVDENRVPFNPRADFVPIR